MSVERSSTSGQASVLVGAESLSGLKYPARFQAGETATRIVVKDSRLARLIAKGSTVEITVRHPSTGQVSNVFAYSR